MKKIVLLPFLLLLQIAAGTERTWNFGSHIATTENGTLKSVECIDPYTFDSFKEWKLVNLGLKDLHINAFSSESCSQIRKLDLRNNWLSTIPAFVFKDLHSLTTLSLADNEITDIEESAFANLDRLDSLNISNNRLTQLGKHQFFGLAPHKIHIYTHGNNITKISNFLFTQRREIQREDNMEINIFSEDISTSLEICFSHNLVLSVSPCTKSEYEYRKIIGGLEDSKSEKESEASAQDCHRIEVKHADGELNLSNFIISGFEENWYKVEDPHIKTIIVKLLNANHSEEFKIADVLNVLPANFEKAVVLSEHYISTDVYYHYRIGTITNKHLRTLNFQHIALKLDNNFSFRYTNLSVLNIHEATLSSLADLPKMPATLTEFNLSKINFLDYLWEGIFSQLNHLVKFRLQGNLEDQRGYFVPTRWFDGLSSLQVLDLSDNNLTSLDPGTFQDLSSLKDLNLRGNRIQFYKGIFTGLENIEILNIANNGLREITDYTLYAMPDTLKTVILDENEIETLNDGSFLRVPKHTLSLVGNRIANISMESLDLRTLKRLLLSNNKLENFDVENLENLEFLDLSENPIKKLAGRALSRLPMKTECIIKVSETPIEFEWGFVFRKN